MIVLGLNAYHGDSAACVLRDGKVIAAAEEERFTRIKHWAGFPQFSIRYCLDEARLSLTDVDVVAVNGKPTANFWARSKYALLRRPSLQLLLDRAKNQVRRLSVRRDFEQAFPAFEFSCEVQHVEHHRAHMASAYFASTFRNAVVLSLDGFGDFASSAWGFGEAETLRVDERINFPHSLGIFYQAITQYLGFPNYGDEYKVMGLAPYGVASHTKEMHELLRLKDGSFELNLSFFRHHRAKLDRDSSMGTPSVDRLYSEELERLLGPSRAHGEVLEQRHFDIARSAQEAFERALIYLLEGLRSRYACDQLAYAGGCALNSVANGKICRESGFKHVFIPPAPGDAGGAIGAAFDVWIRRSNNIRERNGDAYLGPSITTASVSDVIADRQSAIERACCVVRRIGDDKQLCSEIAEAIAAGCVVGWLQGRMEWGPRALGNRSILADPRRADMKEIINQKIKRRESFRPFAPSVIVEHVSDWFGQDVDVPYMSQVFQIEEGKRQSIPAVTHVDGSGRLQTVSRESNPLYYQLISTFYELTGVPILLNTSFNENEPLVCQPSEALECFLRTEMDIVVLGDVVIRRVSSKSVD